MEFNRILEQYVKESEALTKIRVKVDPKDSNHFDFRNLDGYEGYILKEMGDILSVLFNDIDMPVTEVPLDAVDIIDVPDRDMLHAIKMFSLKAIEERKSLTMELINKIMSCNSVDFIEQYLKEEGLTDSEIKDIYKKSLLSNGQINENKYSGFAKFAGKAARVAGNVALGVLAPDYIASKWIGNIRDKFNRPSSNNTDTKNKDGSAKQQKAQTIPTNVAQAIKRTPTSKPYPKPPYLFNLLDSNKVSNYIKWTLGNISIYLNQKTGDIITLEQTGSNLIMKITNLDPSKSADISKLDDYLSDGKLRGEESAGNIRFNTTPLINLQST